MRETDLRLRRVWQSGVAFWESLDRHRQGVAPTQYGRALLDGGAAVFDELRQTVRNIAFLADPAGGEVRIGCNPFLAASFVSSIVERMSRRHPRMTFVS